MCSVDLAFHSALYSPDITRIIQSRLSVSVESYNSIGGLTEYRQYGKSGLAVIRAVEALEIAKAILATPATARYGPALSKAKDEVGYALYPCYTVVL